MQEPFSDPGRRRAGTLLRGAVESLAAQIHRNERGLPTDPRTVMISGRWVEGPTLRPDRSGEATVAGQ